VLGVRDQGSGVGVSKQKLVITQLKTTTENMVIEMELYYSLGGQNWFSGNVDPRGYFACAQPVKIEGDMRCVSSGERSGIKDLVEPAQRFTASKLPALQAKAQPHLGCCLRKVLDRAKLTLAPESAEEAEKFLALADRRVPAGSNVVKPEPLPYTIQTIIDQMGGRGIRGAFVYIGASQLVWKHPKTNTTYECRSGFQSNEDEHGCINSDVSLQFTVNGKRGELWKMLVAYEPDDTYSVWIWRNKSDIPGKIGSVIEVARDVYCDGLKGTVEHMYDKAIKTHNQGFINV